MDDGRWTMNPNLAVASHFAASLAEAGLRAVCIAPGSRSTPLTLAFWQEPAVKLFVHLDERSAAFFALGLALAADRPAALVCTSGTAAANFFPAVIEAKMSQIPLLVLTADRPHELRHSGANQTIDQVKLYGDQVLWSVDAPLPDVGAPDVTMRNIAGLAGRAYAMANGLTKGPVHINFPFRQPLHPTSRPTPAGAPASPSLPSPRIDKGLLLPAPDQVERLAGLIQQHRRGLIVCGPRCPGGRFPPAAAALSRQSGYPLLADPLSGLRYGEWTVETNVIGGYDHFLQNDPGWDEPELILRLGAVPTSKRLNAYLERIRPARRVHLRANGVWADDSHLTTDFIQADETAFCRQLVRQLPARPESKWTRAIRQAEAEARQALAREPAGEWLEGPAAGDIVEALPAGANLFVGNSLPVRHLDRYGVVRDKQLHVYANRGASGIDGNVSTGLGIAAATGRPTLLLLGDITFYHDMNGLLALKKGLVKENVTIVVLNNDGGGIFRRLPIAAWEPPFTELFVTPHGLRFEPVAQLYGLVYTYVADRQAYRDALRAALADPAPHLIEAARL